MTDAQFRKGRDILAMKQKQFNLMGKVNKPKAAVEITDMIHVPLLGRVATKPVFGVSDKARLKPVSSATKTS